jgi:polysaccharide deacetylase family protein (PEP-CTERM system associated)
MAHKASITFSLDLEDHRALQDTPPRYPAITYSILDFLDQIEIRGTVFAVGSVIKSHPELIQEISKRGHELGFHSMHHRPLTRETTETFRDETGAGKLLLEDLTGKPVSGYRAPSFSLVNDSLWTVDILTELEFAYSSSVLPAANPLFGWPGAPRKPFKWPGGLLEFPVPVGTIGGMTVPFMGGIYLRYLPFFLIDRLRRQVAEGQLQWTYIHPYDFDAREPFGRVLNTNFWQSLLLWLNRSNCYRRVERLLADTTSQPFGDIVGSGEFDNLPEIDPVTFS